MALIRLIQLLFTEVLPPIQAQPVQRRDRRGG
jgi:hypothetical protein